MKRLSLLCLVPLTVMLTGCGSDDPSAAAGSVPNFSGALAAYMPKAKIATTATMLNILSDGQVSTMANCSGGDAYSTTAETFGTSIVDGCGMIGRTMGDDPLSIWMTMDMVDVIGKLVEDGTIPVTAGNKTITLNFGIGEAASSGEVTHTFTKDSLQKDWVVGAETMYVTLKNIKGGFTDTIFGVSFNLAVYSDATRTREDMNAQFLFYGELPNGGKNFVIRATRHEFEYYRDDVPTPNRGSRAIFVFDSSAGSENYQYKALSEYKYPGENVLNRLSLVMTGTKLDNSTKAGKFIVRKHAWHPLDTTMSDQWFAVNYNGAATTPETRFTQVKGGQVGSFASTVLPGDTSGLDASFGDLDFVNSSTNMYELTDAVIAARLPASQDVLVINW